MMFIPISIGGRAGDGACGCVCHLLCRSQDCRLAALSSPQVPPINTHPPTHTRARAHTHTHTHTHTHSLTVHTPLTHAHTHTARVRSARAASSHVHSAAPPSSRSSQSTSRLHALYNTLYCTRRLGDYRLPERPGRQSLLPVHMTCYRMEETESTGATGWRRQRALD